MQTLDYYSLDRLECGCPGIPNKDASLSTQKVFTTCVSNLSDLVSFGQSFWERHVQENLATEKSCCDNRSRHDNIFGIDRLFTFENALTLHRNKKSLKQCSRCLPKHSSCEIHRTVFRHNEFRIHSSFSQPPQE